MKKTAAIMLTIAMLMSVCTINTAAEDNKMMVIVNGDVIKFDVAPAFNNKLMMVQAEPILRRLGIKTLYHSKTKTLEAVKGSVHMLLQAGSRSAKVNGETIALSAPIALSGSKIIVPLAVFNCLKVDEVKHIGPKAIIRDFSIPGCESFDTDRDGLSDYQEINKYFTDPDKSDSDGDGKPDGEWDERREYTYSIRTNSTFVLPGDTLELNNRIQDGRVLEQNGSIVDAEIIIYPYTTYDHRTSANYNWKKENSENKQLQPYLRATPQMNWDQAFQRDLLKDLKKAGIQPEKLSDLELVTKVSAWLNDRQKYIYGYSSLAVDLKDGEVYFPEDVKEQYLKNVNTYEDMKDVRSFINQELKNGKSIDEILRDMPLGKPNYYKRVVGECTEHAILWGTVFRALGIPTRVTVVLPILAQGNKEQKALITTKLKEQDNKSKITASFAVSDGAVGSHYYNEVYVGNKWISLDGTMINKNHNTALMPMVQYALMSDPIYFDFYNNWYQMTSGKVDSPSPNGVPYRLNDITDGNGAHINQSPYWNKLKYAKKASENRNKYQPITLLITPNDGVMKAIGAKYPSYYVSGSARWTAKDVAQLKRIAIFDDGSGISYSKEMLSMFEGMKKPAKNYLQVKTYKGKLLVYIKMENRSKLLELIRTIHPDNYDVEQYVNFDTGEEPLI